jgi:oleate hydratase
VAGTGGLATFKDCAWLMSILLAHPPHFIDQPGDVQVFWGTGCFPTGSATTSPSPCRRARALGVSGT